MRIAGAPGEHLDVNAIMRADVIALAGWSMVEDPITAIIGETFGIPSEQAAELLPA